MLTPAQRATVSGLLATVARGEPLSAYAQGCLRALAGSADPEQRAAMQAALRPAQPVPDHDYRRGAARACDRSRPGAPTDL